MRNWFHSCICQWEKKKIFTNCYLVAPRLLDIFVQVGVKGDCKNFNRGLDCDVLVAEVCATCRLPVQEYMYSTIRVN